MLLINIYINIRKFIIKNIQKLFKEYQEGDFDNKMRIIFLIFATLFIIDIFLFFIVSMWAWVWIWWLLKSSVTFAIFALSAVGLAILYEDS